MSDKSKIDIKVGSIAFAAEGDQEWLAEQLEQVLSLASSEGAIQPAAPKTELYPVGRTVQRRSIYFFSCISPKNHEGGEESGFAVLSDR